MRKIGVNLSRTIGNPRFRFRTVSLNPYRQILDNAMFRQLLLPSEPFIIYYSLAVPGHALLWLVSCVDIATHEMNAMVNNAAQFQRNVTRK
jgi:hypothetical protein